SSRDERAKPVSIAERIPGAIKDPTSLKMNATGGLVGQAVDKNGRPSAFFVGGLGVKTKPPATVTFPEVTFNALGDRGVAVGWKSIKRQTRAFVYNGRNGFELPL